MAEGMKEPARYLRQTVSLVILLLAGVLLVYAMWGFITAFLSGLIFYVMLQPLMPFFSVRLRLGRTAAALLLMLASFIIILLPITLTTWMLTSKVSYVLNHSEEILTGLHRIDRYVEEYAGFRILTPETLEGAKRFVAGIIPGFLSRTAQAALVIVIMYFILFFMLTHCGVIEQKIIEYLPFSRQNNEKFVHELENMVMSNVLGAPLLAFIQGVFAWIGYLIFGLPEPLFWAVITALFSFIPVVGTPMVWLPAGLFQITAGQLWPGIGILIYGLVVISNVDNVFRFILQKKIGNIHPLITLLGVIMGIKMLGLPGIVFGPLFISWFLLFIKIYRKEFHSQAEGAGKEKEVIIDTSGHEKNTGS
jgi:predicted PurR-regulated permease PerM